MKVDILGKHTVIVGKRGCGKSNLFQHIVSQPIARNTLVWDINHEHDGQDRILPDHRKGDELREEFGEAVHRMVTGNKRELRPDILAVEEANRVAPNSGKTPEPWVDLIDRGRHYGVGTIAIARRPAQLDTDTVELADNMFVFRVRGKNDVSRLNREADGLGDAAAELDRHECILLPDFGDWVKLEPVPKMDTTGEL